MANNDFGGEAPFNYEQKCPCVLVLDISGSMHGDPIEQLNEGLQQFHEEILNDETASDRLEVSIVTFGSEIKEVQSFSLLEHFNMPYLKTNGSTRMVDGARKAIELVEHRKEYYKKTGQSYYRPYIVLITDGYPDSDQDITGLAQEIHQGVEAKHFNFWAFGVKNADMDLLGNISHSEFAPQKLKGIEFVKFFKWLSASMSTITSTEEGARTNILPETEDSNPFSQFTIKP